MHNWIVRRRCAAFAAAAVALSAGVGGCAGGAPVQPHVDHVALPTYKTWKVVSVQPYEGLSEVELVKFDWPTRENPRMAFTLTKEGLKPGDPICLDHVGEINAFGAHPEPASGCAGFGDGKPPAAAN